jgi:hypothetical protein
VHGKGNVDAAVHIIIDIFSIWILLHVVSTNDDDETQDPQP